MVRKDKNRGLFFLSSSENLWVLIPVTTGIWQPAPVSRLWYNAGGRFPARFHIVPSFVRSRSTAHGRGWGSPWQLDRCCAGHITVLLLRHILQHTHIHILLFVMFTIHFSPVEGHWTKETSVFHALLGWLEALYSWLLPVLHKVHKWITLLVHQYQKASHRNVPCFLITDWSVTSKKEPANAESVWLHISKVWKRKKALSVFGMALRAPAWWSRKKNKQWSFVHHHTCSLPCSPTEHKKNLRFLLSHAWSLL